MKSTEVVSASDDAAVGGSRELAAHVLDQLSSADSSIDSAAPPLVIDELAADANSLDLPYRYISREFGQVVVTVLL
jgi:hypothetical protein